MILEDKILHSLIFCAKCNTIMIVASYHLSLVSNMHKCQAYILYTFRDATYAPYGDCNDHVVLKSTHMHLDATYAPCGNRNAMC